MNRNVEQWEVRKRSVSSERGVVAAQNWMAAAAGADAKGVVLFIQGNDGTHIDVEEFLYLLKDSV